MFLPDTQNHLTDLRRPLLRTWEACTPRRRADALGVNALKPLILQQYRCFLELPAVARPRIFAHEVQEVPAAIVTPIARGVEARARKLCATWEAERHARFTCIYGGPFVDV